MKRKPPDIELPTDWAAELERARPEGIRSKGIIWTPEMDAFLLAARVNDRPVEWETLSALWKRRGWRGWNQTTLRRRLALLQSQNKDTPK